MISNLFLIAHVAITIVNIYMLIEVKKTERLLDLYESANAELKARLLSEMKESK